MPKLFEFILGIRRHDFHVREAGFGEVLFKAFLLVQLAVNQVDFLEAAGINFLEPLNHFALVGMG